MNSNWTRTQWVFHFALVLGLVIKLSIRFCLEARAAEQQLIVTAAKLADDQRNCRISEERLCLFVCLKNTCELLYRKVFMLFEIK